MNWRALATASCLATGWLTAAAAFPPFETWYSSCEGPIATCGHPRPSSVVEEIRLDGARPLAAAGRAERSPDLLPPPMELRPVGTPRESRPDPFHRPPGPRPSPDGGLEGVRAALDLWQSASRTKLPAVTIDGLKLAHDRPDLSGQMRAIARQFDGPVEAHRLQQRYDWRLIRQGDITELAAVPRDRLARLLCPRIVVRLDARGALLGLTFAGGSRRPATRLAMNETRRRTAKIIVPATYESTRADSQHPPARLKSAQIAGAVAMEHREAITPEPRTARPTLRRPDMPLALPRAPVGD